MGPIDQRFILICYCSDRSMVPVDSELLPSSVSGWPELNTLKNRTLKAFPIALDSEFRTPSGRGSD
jgi:hypothetical protein